MEVSEKQTTLSLRVVCFVALFVLAANAAELIGVGTGEETETGSEIVGSSAMEDSFSFDCHCLKAIYGDYLLASIEKGIASQVTCHGPS